MAVMVRLSEQQVEKLVVDMQAMERGLKDLYDELAEAGVPGDILNRFGRLHDRYTTTVNFLLKQRELGRQDEA